MPGGGDGVRMVGPPSKNCQVCRGESEGCCDGVTGDEVKHGGRSCLQPGGVQMSVICVQVALINLDHTFSAATAGRTLALLEEILCGFKPLPWVTELFMAPSSTGGFYMGRMVCMLIAHGEVCGLALALTRFSFHLKALWRSVHKQK